MIKELILMIQEKRDEIEGSFKDMTDNKLVLTGQFEALSMVLNSIEELSNGQKNSEGDKPTRKERVSRKKKSD